MKADQPARARLGWTIAFTLMLPGLGHFLAGRRAEGLAWMVFCQGLLFGGFALAGNTQLDFGQPFSLFGLPLCFLLAPEIGNFLGSQAAWVMLRSVEFNGQYPEALPWRHLGLSMSGASGVISVFLAAHAAGCVLAERRAAQTGRDRGPHPGEAAIANLLLPGLGHALQGRAFKARLYTLTILGLFLAGLALGDFADFNRQRHPYYWIGQMMLGLPGWLVGWIATHLRFERVMPYQDAGLLFTTSAGMFNVIAALDAWQRVEQDWKRAPASATEPAAAGGGA